LDPWLAHAAGKLTKEAACRRDGDGGALGGCADLLARIVPQQIRLLLDRAAFGPWLPCAVATVVPCWLSSSSSRHHTPSSVVCSRCSSRLGGDKNGNQVLLKPGLLETDAHRVFS
jgi:hypothetical protein